MSLRCFIAMALGHTDTDEVYENLIVPTLRRIRRIEITPILVYGLEYNEDIDDRIITELNQSDFVIADLTYARPSVYFEAGYAQRQVPVIYTCRKDHLTPKPDDKLGNFKVHFDLQMKNIIPWTHSRDGNFVRRLEKRINRTITPTIRIKEAEQVTKQQIAEFASLPLNAKVRSILDACVSKAKDSGYEEVVAETYKSKKSEDAIVWSGYPILLPPLLSERLQWMSSYGSPLERLSGRRLTEPSPVERLGEHRYEYEQLQFFKAASLDPKWLGVKTVDNTLRSMFIHVTPSLVKSTLKLLDDSILREPLCNISPLADQTGYSHLYENVLLCSLHKVPKSRIDASFPSFHFDKKNNEFISKRRQTIPKAKIQGFDEIYAVWGGETLLARNTSEDYPVFLDIKRGKIKGTTREIVGETKGTTRTIRVHIIDDIKSMDAFDTSLATVMTRVGRLR